ncbi:unannotated protein [freshwater metagenome]|uniref:Unannotated protein n=1 Tax=freshwater metagenome TaxID=449393 RepID=A0A6J5ZD87_9ZZZZ
MAIEDDYIAYLRESKKESILVLLSRAGISTTLDLSSLGYSVEKTLYGVKASGKTVIIESGSATQGVWLLRQV